MNKTSQWIFSGTLAALLVATLSVGGCATEAPKKPSGIEQRIQNARTTADHEEIASQYEKQAEVDKATARMHLGMANTYKYYAGPKNTNPGAFAAHCNNLAKLYQQAADENLELAKLHREVAAGIRQ